MQKMLLWQSQKLKKTEIDTKMPPNMTVLLQHLSLVAICHLYGHSGSAARLPWRNDERGKRWEIRTESIMPKFTSHLPWWPLTLNPFKNCEIFWVYISSILGWMLDSHWYGTTRVVSVGETHKFPRQHDCKWAFEGWEIVTRKSTGKGVKSSMCYFWITLLNNQREWKIQWTSLSQVPPLWMRGLCYIRAANKFYPSCQPFDL